MGHNDPELFSMSAFLGPFARYMWIDQYHVFFCDRWIEHADGSQDVAEDKNTPCGTLSYDEVLHDRCFIYGQNSQKAENKTN